MVVFALSHTCTHTHTHTHTHTRLAELQFWLVDLGGQCVEGSQMGSKPSRCSCYCWERYSREDIATDLRSGRLYALCAEAWMSVWSVFSLLMLHQSTSVFSVERETQKESLTSKYNPVTPDTVCYLAIIYRKIVFKTILQKKQTYCRTTVGK